MNSDGKRRFWTAFVGTVIIGGVAAAVIFLANLNDNRRAEDKAKIEQRYGVDIEAHHKTDCLNGWLVVLQGRYGWLYVRDEHFNPIKCKQ